jgi:hypothetical protein
MGNAVFAHELEMRGYVPRWCCAACGVQFESTEPIRNRAVRFLLVGTPICTLLE